MFKDGQALRRAAVAVPIAVGLTAVAFTGTVSAASKTVTCERRGFVAAVRYGTNFGLAVSGTLRLKVKPSGDVSGTITNNAKKRFRVVGHVAGRAINLLIRYRDTGWIAGTGTLERPIERCSGFIGGTFAGPSDGDFGDWSDTQSFGNGMQSMGSPPLGQNLPVIKNPHWDSGRLILSSDAAFIKTGAIVIVYPVAPYGPEFVPLYPDPSGVPQVIAGPGTNSGIPLRTFIPSGATVTIQIMNPDGKLGISAMFTRP